MYNNYPLHRKTLIVGVMATTMAVGLSTAIAQDDFPSKPLNVTVSYTAGGATDFQARIALSKAEEYLGQSAVVVNRPGAGGQVGWNHLVNNGSDDGHDLAAYNMPHFIAQSLTYDTHYNLDNLEPIANWGMDPAVLIVRKDSEFDTIDDLVEYAKANPGKVTVSGAGLFVGHHIATLQLEEAAGVELEYLPTSGAVDGLRFVEGGQVMAGFNNLSDSYRAQDRLKILGIAAMERDEKFLPDVPTFLEAGYDIDDSSVNVRGLMTRSGVSEEKLEKLSEAAVAMFNDEEVQAKMEDGGSPMLVVGRDELMEMWQERHDYLEELFANMDTKAIEEAANN